MCYLVPYLMRWLQALCFLFLFSCARPEFDCSVPQLTSINIIDRNGFSETISLSDRLKNYEDVDFLSSLPYQKVLRIYGQEGLGDVLSYITSYYPNGQPQQYLEVVNGRACGCYKEWHSNGILKAEACVIGGEADITPNAIRSWLFDGLNRAWNDQGILLAEIIYEKGVLEGISTYYHECGTIWKTEPYCRGVLEGTVEIFRTNGEMLQTVQYSQGVKHGPSIRYWAPGVIAADEQFHSGLLVSGAYFDIKGEKISEIINGCGSRAIFGKSAIAELQEYRQGEQDGEIRLFNGGGQLVAVYNTKNGLKHGLETLYYEGVFVEKPIPKLSLGWVEGKVQGIAKTWYPDGTLESQREISNNSKNGLLTAWYKDGSIMLIEEYERDKLIKGDYFRKNEKIPVSRVIQGKGTATLFDADGNYTRKVNYYNNRPVD